MSKNIQLFNSLFVSATIFFCTSCIIFSTAFPILGNKTFGDYFITYLHVAIFDKPMVVICLFVSIFLYYKSYKIYKNLN